MSYPKITLKRRPEGYQADADFLDGRNYHAIGATQALALLELALFWIAQEGRAAEGVSCENPVKAETFATLPDKNTMGISHLLDLLK